MIRLPNGMLYDGGYGVQDDARYKETYQIEDMLDYDLSLLEARCYRL